MNKSTLKTALLAVFSLVFVNSFSQTVQWAEKGISPGFEYGNAITTDNAGGIYVAGQIEYTTQFSGQSLTSRGGHDIFVGKYSTNGTLEWLKSAGGLNGDVAYGVGVDASHNCYITGEIEDTAFFDNDSLIADESNDIFVAKYDANGNYLWSKCFGSEGNDKGFAMAVNPSGDCFITGYYSADIDFDNVHLSHAGSADVFIAKLDENGDVDWVKKGGGSRTDRGHGITYDNSGNVYVAGFFTQSASFSGNSISTGNDVRSAFVVKYSSSGSFRWINSACCDSSEFNAISVDENGNVYATGFFYNAVTFGNITLNSAGKTDIMIVKYDPFGNVIWAKQAGGPYSDIGFGITVDSINHIVYVTGQLDDHGYFDTRYAGAAGNRDVFVAAYDYNGNNLWVKPYGGVQRDIGYAISHDRNGNIVTTGIFFDNATFGNYNLTGNLLADFYVHKITPPIAAVAPPAIPSTNLIAFNSNCNDLHLTFTPGNGSGRIIVAREGAPVNETPVDGTNYMSGSVFGSGQNLGNGNFVVYKGNGNSETISGLQGNSIYHFAVFEYNGTGGSTAFLTNNPATVSQATSSFTINIQSSALSFCEGDHAVLTASGGNNYQWSPSTGLTSTTGNVVTATPTSSTIYTVTADDNGCQAQNTISLNVNPLPAVSLTLNNSICINDGETTLTSGTPTGGVYSGNGVSSGIFDPVAAGIGASLISYTYSDANGCSSTASSQIEVIDAPSISLGNDSTICSGYSVSLNAGNGFSSYLWSNGSTASNITVDSSGTGLGTTTVYVLVENNSGCFNSDTMDITFDLCAGIDQSFDILSAIQVFPNPFNSTFQILLEENADVSIYDITGRLIEKFTDVKNNDLFGANLLPGVYIIEFTRNDFRGAMRIIKS